jgi:hypothetical protein
MDHTRGAMPPSRRRSFYHHVPDRMPSLDWLPVGSQTLAQPEEQRV